MSLPAVFKNLESARAIDMAQAWHQFLQQNNFDYSQIEQIDLSEMVPIITDVNKNKFSIDFINDKKNYHKKKLSIKSELLSKALGGGKHGLKVLDLSAGLAIDSVFLAELGYEVTALERNPLIYLCLQTAIAQSPDLKIKFHFSDAKDFLKSKKPEADVVYFDPMFPEKEKSALPRQEMVFFKALVGADEDASEVLELALKLRGIKRVVVKRPLKAVPLKAKPSGNLKGKLIRFDIYGVNS